MAKSPTKNETKAQAENDWDQPDQGASQGGNDGGVIRADQNDAVAEELEEDEKARRAELPNMQTTREREDGIDPVSGTKNPGVVEGQTGHTAQGVAGDNDMSGKKALPDPLAALDKARVDEVHKALTEAEKQDVAAYRAPKGVEDEEQKRQHKVASMRSTGWRSLADLGVHRDTLEALVKAGKVERDHAPGMHHHGDTGVVYRIKKDRG